MVRQLVDGMCFFSSSVADVALMARSLHVSKQTKLCTRTNSPAETAKQTAENKPNPKKKDGRNVVILQPAYSVGE